VRDGFKPRPGVDEFLSRGLLKGYIIRFHKTKKKQFARSDLTFLILGVERSDFVRISDKIFLILELDFEMLAWTSWISRWSFVAFRGDSRWGYSIVHTTENQKVVSGGCIASECDRSHSG